MKKVSLFTVVISMIVVLLGAGPSIASDETISDSYANGDRKFTTVNENSTNVSSRSASEGSDQAYRMLSWPWSGQCEHVGESDNIHLTNGQTEVSVHGWWLALNNECPSKADVWVELQARSCIYDNGNWHCFWQRLDRSQPKRIYSGGGSANRVNARHNCVSRTSVSFRVVVDVDIPGEIDSSAKMYKRFDLRCYPEG